MGRWKARTLAATTGRDAVRWRVSPGAAMQGVTMGGVQALRQGVQQAPAWATEPRLGMAGGKG